MQGTNITRIQHSKFSMDLVFRPSLNFLAEARPRLENKQSQIILFFSDVSTFFTHSNVEKKSFTRIG
jgi:hypothetical protein